VVEKVRKQGMRTAVVTASSNAEALMDAAGIGHLFDAKVDGKDALELDLKGKPAPDTYLEAARRVGAPPERAVVVEDALAGVKAGRAGGFGLVLGVARHGNLDELARHGADEVVTDLGELLTPPKGNPGSSHRS
jgi:alpha,alpha-trehalose phosphorylase